MDPHVPEAQRALVELGAAFQSAPVGLAVLDPELRYIHVNDLLAWANGVPAAEHIGRTVRQVVGDQAALVEPLLHRVMETRVPLEGLEIQRADPDSGEQLHWILSFTPLIVNDGVAGIVGTALEVTGPKRVEQALRASEARQAFLVRLGDTLRPLRDPVEIQSEAARALGEHLQADRVMYGEVEGEREDDTFIIHRDYRRPDMPSAAGRHRFDAFGTYVASAFREGLTLAVPNVFATEEHTEADLAAYEAVAIGAYMAVPLVKGGHIAAYLAVNQRTPRSWSDEDVALVEEVAERTWSAVERARVEAALHQSEARYRALFESMDEGFCTVEVLLDDEQRPFDYRFMETNPAFVQQTGLQDTFGRTIREVVPDIEPFWIDTYGRVALTGEPVRFEAPAAALGRWYDVYALRVGDPDERRVAILFNDITVRKDAEASLQRINEMLEGRVAERTRELSDANVELERVASDLRRSNDELQRFAHIASHDLQEPLRKVKMFADVLGSTEAERLSGDGRDALERMTSAATRMGRLIQGLLTFSRVSSRANPFQQVDLSTVARSAVAELQAEIERTDAVVNVEVDAAATITADQAQVKQALVAVLDNALKFKKANEPASVRVWAEEEGAWVHLIVEDKGIGFEQRFAERIMQPFERLHGRGVYEGNGLGLAVAKRIAERHRGSLVAEGREGEGARFTFVLPRLDTP